jgi:uncharacterized protein (UPF0548 family)
MEAAAEWDEVDEEIVVGTGAARFDQVRERLLSWGIHRGAGLRVLDALPRVAPGTTARLRVRLLALPTNAPVKIWSVIDEPGRAGFAYTTLPGHQVEGFEEFLVQLRESGEVAFRIRARSRPASWAAKRFPALARRVQRQITRRYLAAARTL